MSKPNGRARWWHGTKPSCRPRCLPSTTCESVVQPRCVDIGRHPRPLRPSRSMLAPLGWQDARWHALMMCISVRLRAWCPERATTVAAGFRTVSSTHSSWRRVKPSYAVSGSGCELLRSGPYTTRGWWQLPSARVRGSSQHGPRPRRPSRAHGGAGVRARHCSQPGAPAHERTHRDTGTLALPCHGLRML